MAISPTDIKFRLSTTSGAAGNSTVAGGVGSSLGKYMSTTDLTTSNLFPDVTGAQNATQSPSYFDYQCVFIFNNHGTLDALNSVLYISSQVASGVDVTIGLDPAGQVAATSGSNQAAVIASATTLPASVTFSTPNQVSPLSIGTLAHGNCIAFWVRRESKNTGPLNNDGATFEFDFDTAA